MSLPVTEPTEKTAVMLMATFFGLNSYEPDIILGAFAGSIIFVVSATDFAIWARFALFTSSMLIGVTSASFTASLLSSVLNKFLLFPVIPPVPVGATVAAAAAVRLLMYLSTRPLKVFSALERFRQGGNK
ncbi:TPA: hypothetical protein N2F56_003015 [Salmonella enterica]|nr:hypothetical protein [Salmonella enterica subsp. houtenae]HCL4435441.1 hypothetical protein [Salmonella enterica]HCL5082572.1 hypothetical protein [Salmonella enterica]